MVTLAEMPLTQSSAVHQLYTRQVSLFVSINLTVVHAAVNLTRSQGEPGVATAARVNHDVLHALPEAGLHGLVQFVTVLLAFAVRGAQTVADSLKTYCLYPKNVRYQNATHVFHTERRLQIRRSVEPKRIWKDVVARVADYKISSNAHLH